MENGSPVIVVAFIGHFLVFVGVAEKHEDLPGEPGAGLDDVGNVAGIAVILVDILHVLTREFLVPGKIEICPVVHTFQFLEAHGEFVFDVVGILGVVSQFVLAVTMPAQLVHPDTQLFVVSPALFPPIVEKPVVIAGFDEVLHFHLLELTGSKNKVLGYYFVAEGLAYLRDSKGNLHAVGLDYILVINVDALGGFGTQVDKSPAVVHRANIGFEHKIELAGIGEFAAAIGTLFAGQFVLIDLIGPKTGFALFAVHQGIGKVFHMS